LKCQQLAQKKVCVENACSTSQEAASGSKQHGLNLEPAPKVVVAGSTPVIHNQATTGAMILAIEALLLDEA